MTPLYQMAVQSIRAHVDAEQARLDRAAQEARTATIAAYRLLAVKDVPADSPAYPVCSLVSATLSIGRDDGYPDVTIPAETIRVIIAATRAGVLSSVPNTVVTGRLVWHRDCSGLSSYPDPWQADRDAWSAARDYREKQTVASL